MVSEARDRGLIVDRILETGMVPDPLLRLGIRRSIALRLRNEDAGSEDANRRRKDDYVALLRASPLAVETAAANKQHYEVPSEFFQIVLGRHMKYSCALWSEGVRTLDDAEEAMLRLTSERAGLENGQTVLELGCGWGSLSLWMARHYPDSRIVAVSNSKTQKDWIEGQVASAGIDNLEVLTREMSVFETDRKFDRVVSVEMFEHMRNYEELMRRIAGWLVPGGLLFVHIFAHARFAYLFEDRGPSDWMARYFFTGGQMPSRDLLPRFRGELELLEQWTVDGTHYEKTAKAWLEKMDANSPEVRRIFERTYGGSARRFFVYWRIFFMACEELFAYRGGSEWQVEHYVFRKPV